MRRNRIVLPLMIVVVLYTASCARGITPHDAANGKARCGKYLR